MSSHQRAPAIFTPEQCRAARAVLKLTVEATGRAADVAKNSVVKFEAGEEVRPIIAEKLRLMFEGEHLTFDHDGLRLSWQGSAARRRA